MNADPESFSAQEGAPVDLAPWTYVWRADRDVQPQPEAYFIPRRLDRLDRIYRTAYDALPQDQLKSLYYDMPTVLEPLPPAPEGDLLAGLLWTGGLVDYEVQLHWPAGSKPPAPTSVEVRAYPSAFGWFGWTVDQILEGPVVSSNGLTWVYKSDPTVLMDFAYSTHPPAATEMVAVFCRPDTSGALPAVPALQVVGASLGDWRRMDIELEGGFVESLEPYLARLGSTKPLGGGRHGIALSVTYAPDAPPGLDSRITVRGKSGDFTLSLKDLDKGPMLLPTFGAYVTKAGGPTAAEFSKQLAAKGLKSLRQQVRDHPEATSWDQLMQEVRFWTCPEGTLVPPFPDTPAPAMQVHLSDERWTEAWSIATDQMRGPHLWPRLGHEIGRVVRDMELVGLHDYTPELYDYFLESPGVKADGDYVDAAGSLEWATAMRHDMGYSHEGTHPSTGRLLLAMCERYFLTGDPTWFEEHRARLQAAADWIIRERREYMADLPNRDKLFVAGLLPPAMMGDYALPASDWHWYYSDNALALQGLQRFADVLMQLDPKAGRKYEAEADAYRADLKRIVEEDAALAPVRLGRDGMYHSFIPRMAYCRGLTGPELGAPQFPDCDLFWGSLPVADVFGALEASDYRVVGTVDAMEELGTSQKTIQSLVDARRQKGLPTEDAWFWCDYSFLPKISHNANIYLLEDDVPNFLRFLFNSYAGMVGANGKVWEHWHLGQFTDCDVPDTMTAGWFVENFRNALALELGDTLWLGRGTPRAWLEQGKTISVAKAPTYFGTLAYQVTSDIESGSITATIDLPSRTPAKEVILRLRRPDATPIKSVSVNGQPWKAFDPDEETITLSGLSGQVTVVARY